MFLILYLYKCRKKKSVSQFFEYYIKILSCIKRKILIIIYICNPILIYNIQGTSGVNLFPQRMKDDTINIVEDDISWNEEHNNGMVITRRTGIDNIDLVSYYDSSLIKEQRHLS